MADLFFASGLFCISSQQSTSFVSLPRMGGFFFGNLFTAVNKFCLQQLSTSFVFVTPPTCSCCSFGKTKCSHGSPMLSHLYESLSLSLSLSMYVLLCVCVYVCACVYTHSHGTPLLSHMYQHVARETDKTVAACGRQPGIQNVKRKKKTDNNAAACGRPGGKQILASTPCSGFL